MNKIRFTILTLFQEYFKTPLQSSLLGKAIEQGLIEVRFVNIRDFGEGRYKAVDDKPYGGGPGMVMTAPVLERALQEALKVACEEWVGAPPHVIYLSPQGQPLTAQYGRSLVKSHQNFILICGHYEGIDERFIEAFVNEEISIGDYILTGGEPAALVLIDSLARFVPGVVGDEASVAQDTFEGEGLLKAPLYTRPALWQGRSVPDVLVSGHHQEVEKWRRLESQNRTEARRPDLLSKRSS